jgi:hypothetical protein
MQKEYKREMSTPILDSMLVRYHRKSGRVCECNKDSRYTPWCFRLDRPEALHFHLSSDRKIVWVSSYDQKVFCNGYMVEAVFLKKLAWCIQETTPIIQFPRISMQLYRASIDSRMWSCSWDGTSTIYFQRDHEMQCQYKLL